MPEGDTLYRAAARLDAAIGDTLAERISGSHRALRSWLPRIQDRRVTKVENIGKHLFIHLDGSLSIRTHLGMTGKWHVYRPGEPWRTSAGKARLVIENSDAVAVCFAAPEVEVGPTADVLGSVAHLGPDLTGDEFDAVEAITRVQAAGHPTAAETLLDQTLMAGVGNVFKSEILFMQRIHPKRSPETLEEGQAEDLVARARKLLYFNRSRSVRNTTGYTRKGSELWVYDRRRLPCRRCGTEIAAGDIAERVTYWCPRCQT